MPGRHPDWLEAPIIAERFQQWPGHRNRPRRHARPARPKTALLNVVRVKDAQHAVYIDKHDGAFWHRLLASFRIPPLLLSSDMLIASLQFCCLWAIRRHTFEIALDA